MPRSDLDPAFMALALELSRLSRPSPNPRVGAVIVNGGRVAGRGHHERPGMPHAEIVALGEAGSDALGADMYVTLEPCCHQGRTGPCTAAIAAAGVARVAIGMIDPDSRVNGKGVAALEAAGVECHVGLLADECAATHEAYATHRRLGRPLVTLKAAVTLDGMSADVQGGSKWITGEPARAMVHAMRAEVEAVIVGVETVLTDDPLLTVRLAPGRSPMRVVMDSGLRTPATANVIATAAEVPTVLAHAGASLESAAAYAGLHGVEILECSARQDGRVDPADLLSKLAARGVLSVLVEGGGRVHEAFLTAGLADRLALFLAPRLLGGGLPWVRFEKPRLLAQALRLESLRVSRAGDDLLLEGRLGR
ncbi:MAG: bifunctional diaminohydroxyphosphoribosylaminopyrimidine deaminase/5-amino-6-(5-phosphoribosylamino)uracil reductase RibD [Deltaproteobacteria bacterium]|nr:bifunctional diaminohydroxyphosphoribosylaminopyrimidine deaminase/5-amino-6-(5-phosphoribosylamino)uracil reductase RibD [Deltaproteobacteria bacterium]